MTSIVLIISLLVALFYVYRYDLQMLQQNSYRRERYLNWFKKSNGYLSVVKLIFIAVDFMLVAFPYWWAEIVATVVAAGVSVYYATRKYKKPIVFTKRVWRLISGNFILTLALLIPVFIVLPGFAAIVAVLCAILSHVITLVSLWALQPVENAINKKYYDEAASILASMPGLKVVGITGSYGKTSTKHYLNRILSEKYNVIMTPGSFNTPMGVIRTIREMMKPYNDLFIVEMGAKNIGDIKEICDLVHPQMGIVTAVGPQHLESFKTIENVQRTKFELVDALPADGFAVVNNDFQYISNREIGNVKSARYAVAKPQGADYHAEDITYSSAGTSFRIVGSDGVNMELHTHLVGECNISNLLAAVIMAIRLEVPEDKIRYAVSKIEQVEHRLNVKRTPGGLTIIDDAFNSNPDGSRMALDVISGMTTGKRIVITPGMIELGSKQVECNTEFGKKMAVSCDIAIVVGAYNRDAIVDGLRQGGMSEDKIVIVDSFAQAQAHLLKIASPGDTVLYENDLPDTFK